MPELLQTTIVRPAQALSPKEIAAIAHITHPENIQSKRYKEWCEIEKKQDKKQLESSMQKFIKAKETYINTSDFPSGFKEILQFAEYNAYDVTLDELQKYTTQVSLEKIFGKELKKGIISPKSDYYKVRSLLEDILLVQMISNTRIPQNYDVSKALYTLELCKRVFLFNDSKTRKINIKKHYGKPLVVNMCTLMIDPCKDKPLDPIEADMNNSVIITSQKNRNIKEEDCDCKCEEECIEQDMCCDEEIIPYVAELFVVKDEIGSYEAGEMSYIENIMKDEIRVRKHRHLQREEIYTESEEEINIFEEKEHQVDEQFSLHKEVDKVIDKELSLDAGATYTYGKEGGPMVFTAEINASSHTAKKDARKLVQDKSKQVIEKAISRIEKRVRTLSTQKMINETEEKNKHVFGGEFGATEDMSRQFYYVNQLRKAQVFSYGMRQMIDIILPDPAAHFVGLLEIPFNANNPGVFDLEKPNCAKITRDSYLNLANAYGILNVPKPDPQPSDTSMSIPISMTVGKNGNKTYSVPVTIPNNYIATEMSILDCSVTMHKRNAQHHRVNVKLDSGMVEISRGDNSDENYHTCSSSINVTGSSNFTITTLKLRDFNLTIVLKLKAKSVDLSEWKQDVCILLNDAYEKKQKEYKQALEDYKKAKIDHEEKQKELRREKYNQHPFVMSQIIKEQLQQAVISYITCQFFDSNNAMKSKVKPCGFPQMNIREAKKEGDFVRFFENAFEWKFMNYILYPSFWGRKCTWKDKTQDEGSNNNLFNKFLQAGSVRVTLAAKKDYANLVNYYLKHKKIWGYSGVVPTSGTEFLPIIQELKESKNNFNADRDGYVSWNSSNSTIKNEIILYDNNDYYIEEIDPNTGQPTGQYTFDPKVDINREITINCIVYRIVKIEEINGNIVITLDRGLEEPCSATFEDIYEGTQLPWSTGAVYVGAPWMYKVPTSLVWLREKGGCLPCSYPIECGE